MACRNINLVKIETCEHHVGPRIDACGRAAKIIQDRAGVVFDLAPWLKNIAACQFSCLGWFSFGPHEVRRKCFVFILFERLRGVHFADPKPRGKLP